MKEALGAWMRSPLAISSLGICLIGGPLAGFLTPPGALAGLGSGILLWIAFSIVSLQAGWGAKAIVASRDAVEAAKRREAIAATETALARLSRIRLPEPRVAKALERFVLEAGQYTESCRKEDSHSPEADARIADALDLVNLYLKELDESATEKRYGLKDADPFADATARVLSALNSDADRVREERLAISGGLPPEALMRIKEELT